MENKIDWEAESVELFMQLPKEQVDEVMNQTDCDIEPVFMGFVGFYKRLAEMIPKHFTVIDLGCAFNPQCWYFRNHERYVAVDSSDSKKFKTDNCEIYNMSIGDFIKNNLSYFDLNTTFAICSYVPMWGEKDKDIVTKNFKNLFVFYPSGNKLTF